MHLIPAVKEMTCREGFLMGRTVCPDYTGDSRLEKALTKLPCEEGGILLTLTVGQEAAESYSLTVNPDSIAICAEGPTGAFYGIQTLRQLLQAEQVPCLEIHDRPDFSYRGFYHDATRGRIATVERIKALVDDMVRFKMNSLQLYVEHVFEFQETADITPKTGCYTRAELEEIDAYCRENFVDFVPSLATFGHMNEILSQPRYQHLRVLSDYEMLENRWRDRMAHHTIDPRQGESIELVKSLIDQYAPCFTSEWFNICCDETFDLKHATENPEETGRLYVDFVRQIVSHVRSKGRKVMMWADIMLQHPETIAQLPQDVMFLNWNYGTNLERMENMISTLAKLGCNQIVCPGTTTWNRFCEKYVTEVPNILNMVRLGYQYGVKGVLNTNWGDWGNPCSLELGMFGLVLGAAASWNAATENDETFHSHVNALLYGSEHGMETLIRVSAVHDKLKWLCYIWEMFGREMEWMEEGALPKIRKEYREITALLETQTWGNDAYRQAILLAIEAICVVAERGAQEHLTDCEAFLARYRKSWEASSKESELKKIEAAFRWEFTGQLPTWDVE